MGQYGTHGTHAPFLVSTHPVFTSSSARQTQDIWPISHSRGVLSEENLRWANRRDLEFGSRILTMQRSPKIQVASDL